MRNLIEKLRNLSSQAPEVETECLTIWEDVSYVDQWLP